jgi:hypothetical protein
MPEPRQLDAFTDRSASINPTNDWAVGYRVGERGTRWRWYELVNWIGSQLSSVFAAITHQHPSTSISDSTEVGRAVLVAASKAAARSAMDAEALLANRVQLEKIGQDEDGNPTWNSAPWPNPLGTNVEIVLRHPDSGYNVRLFVNDSNNLDWEVIPPAP